MRGERMDTNKNGELRERYGNNKGFVKVETVNELKMVVVVQIKLNELHELDKCTWKTQKYSAQQ